MKRIIAVVVLWSLMFCCAPAVWADEKKPDTRSLTVDEAVTMALNNSIKLKNSKNAIDAAYETRQQSSANSLGGFLSPATEVQAMRFMSLLQRADANWQSARKDYTLREDAVTFATHKAYNGVLQAQSDLRLSELEKKNAETQLTVAQARYRVGMSQLLDLQKAEKDVVTTKGALDGAVKSLDDKYLELNYLLGFWPQGRPVLTEMPEFKKLEVIDLNNYIERSLADSPSQWKADNAVSSAKYALDAYDGSDNYRVLELTVDQRVLDAADARDQARKSLQSLYYNILMTEDNLPAIEQNILVAAETLRVTDLKYKTGMATRAEVVAAETALARVEKSKIDLICNHDVQVLTFAKPWTLSP